MLTAKGCTVAGYKRELNSGLDDNVNTIVEVMIHIFNRNVDIANAGSVCLRGPEMNCNCSASFKNIQLSDIPV